MVEAKMRISTRVNATLTLVYTSLLPPTSIPMRKLRAEVQRQIWAWEVHSWQADCGKCNRYDIQRCLMFASAPQTRHHRRATLEPAKLNNKIKINLCWRRVQWHLSVVFRCLRAKYWFCVRCCPCCRQMLEVERQNLLVVFSMHRRLPCASLLELESSCPNRLAVNWVELQLLWQCVEHDRKLLRSSRHSTMHRGWSTKEPSHEGPSCEWVFHVLRARWLLQLQQRDTTTATLNKLLTLSAHKPQQLLTSTKSENSNLS